MRMVVAAWAVGGLASIEAGAQEDSVVVRAGERYAAGPLHRAIFGSGYRDLWTLPIRVPVLRPDSVAEGLRPTERGGGAQTVSLQFQAPDGREFVFRSVDKYQSGGLHPDLRRTVVSAIAQDQVSTKHPGAAMVVARLLEAAGVLHATPRLAVLADYPGLGEFREEFAGMLGMLEERPNEAATVGPFAKFERIIGTDRLFERLEESPEDRADAAAYLRARLVDFLIGDWDRHPDQWRWAQVDRDGRRYWLPIPRDRDNAFSHVAGLIGVVGGAIRENVMPFGHEYANLYGMHHNAQPLDRLILPELPREQWMAIAGEVQRSIDDSVIAEAVAAMPAPYVTANGPALTAALRTRRDSLSSAAASFYQLIVLEPDVYATDVAETATVEALEDGSVRVRIATAEDEPYYDRVFDPEETRSIRVWLRGGDDEAIVRGQAPPLVQVRILGGGGDDALLDTTAGTNVLLYDDRGDNRFEEGPGTVIDRRPYELDENPSIVENNPPAPRDWGAERSYFSPTAAWVSEIGPVVAAGPVWTRYGFRRVPYASQTRVTVAWAPLETRFGVDVEHARLWTGGDGATRFRARASNLALTRFYGFGNDTAEPEESSDRHVWARELTGMVELVRDLGDGWEASLAPIVAQLDPSPDPGFPQTLAGTAGLNEFGVAGGRLSGAWDARDSRPYPRRGAWLEAWAEAFPAVWGDAPSAFGRGGVVGRAYLPLPAPMETTLALRAGGTLVSDEAPLQYSAFVGGGGTVRGYRTQRYAGDAAAFGSAELRARLARANLLVARGDLGVIALADAGRVWWDAEDSDSWHTAFGGGLWFGPLDRELILHMVYAYGDRHTLSAGFGMPF